MTNLDDSLKTEDQSGYQKIFRTTFLFGFVQAFNIAVKVVINKVAALILGPEGVGIIGLLSSSIGMLKTGTSLGISQSAVRDISAAHEQNDKDRFSKTILTTRRVILITALLGIVVTLSLSPLLSDWAFGNHLYIPAFIALSLAVAFTTLWEGQLAILKGMRRLRLLAYSNMMGAVAGLIVAIPLYLFFGERGIIPVLIITPLCALLFSNYYVRKIDYQRIKLSYKEVFQNASPMLKMGLALSFAAFMSQLSTFVISSFIRSEGGTEHLGFYSAGIMIMVGYFSVVINALTTDYYPRISAVNTDNRKLQDELNKQSMVSLLICFPLIVLFIFLLPFIIQLLYSTEFLPAVEFIKVGIFGTLIGICSNQVDLILIAKNKTTVYTTISFFYRLIEIAISVILYKYYGLLGMGIAILIMALLHLAVMVFIVNKLYAIRFQKRFLKAAATVIVFIITASLLSQIHDDVLKHISGAIVFILSVIFSYYFSKRNLGLNIAKMFHK